MILCGAMSCAMVAQTTGEEAGHTWIDLGLPSGIKWASTNIGATRPQDVGNYYAWGETTLKTDFRWATYAHGTAYNSLTKYSLKDGLWTLDATDDVVSCTWGGTWRMPTKNEWSELQEHCAWTWTDDYNETGVAGYVVASKSNDASLFCLRQVVVMPTKLTKKEYTVTIGRVRCSTTILLTVAQPTSYNFFRLLSNPIGTTHAIMVLLCVVCVIPKRQRAGASYNPLCGNDA